MRHLSLNNLMINLQNRMTRSQSKMPESTSSRQIFVPHFFDVSI